MSQEARFCPNARSFATAHHRKRLVFGVLYSWKCPLLAPSATWQDTGTKAAFSPEAALGSPCHFLPFVRTPSAGPAGKHRGGCILRRTCRWHGIDEARVPYAFHAAAGFGRGKAAASTPNHCRLDEMERPAVAGGDDIRPLNTSAATLAGYGAAAPADHTLN